MNSREGVGTNKVTLPPTPLQTYYLSCVVTVSLLYRLIKSNVIFALFVMKFFLFFFVCWLILLLHF